MLRPAVTLSLIFACIAVGPATAQEQDPAQDARFRPGGQLPRGEITFFSNPGFSGARFTVTGPRTNVSIPYAVRSVIVLQGEQWEVCTRTDYRNCTTLSASSRSVNMLVRSARPIDEFGGNIGGQTLRGMASQYYPAPSVNGRRVRVVPSTADRAQDRANRFCKRAGYNYSRFQLLQTVGGQVYLADVLCTRS
jgi:hypothetical protein